MSGPKYLHSFSEESQSYPHKKHGLQDLLVRALLGGHRYFQQQLEEEMECSRILRKLITVLKP